MIKWTAIAINLLILELKKLCYFCKNNKYDRKRTNC